MVPSKPAAPRSAALHSLPTCTRQEELAAATMSDGVTLVFFLYPNEIRRLISSPLLFFQGLSRTWK